jgi:adenosylcobinamide-GDP ribazoletransferase
MTSLLRALSVAVAFLTVLPTPVVLPASPREDGLSFACFPLVGLLLGVLLGLLCLAVQAWPPLLAAAIVLAAWTGLTGALHVDGLVDSADAWLGGIGDRERTLAIMQDPHCGSAGLVTAVLVLLVKFAALVSLVEHGAWTALIAIPVLSRAAMVGLFLVTPYVRPRGIMHDKIGRAPRGAVLTVTLASVAVATFVLGHAAAATMLAGGAAAWLLRLAMLKRLGGTTGDTAGALVELVEVVMLVAVAVLAQTP